MRKRWKDGLVSALAGLVWLGGACIDGQAQTTDMTVSAIFHDPAYRVHTPAGLQYRLQGDSYDVWEDVGLVRVRQDGNKQEVGRDTLVRWADVASALSLPAENPVFDFIWNPQRDAVLLLSEREAIYRWSYRCSAYLLTWPTAGDAASGKGMRVLPLKGAIQEPAFSPDGRRLSYIRDNNLYVFDFKDKSTELALTEDGAFNRILNGHTDWVYEEEFGFTKAYAWSPDSRYIAYLRSDESRVPEFGFTQWGPLYPRPYVYKYPKAGEDNSTVQLIVYDLLLHRTQPLCRTEAHSTGGASEAVAYIPRLRWTPKSNTLLFYTLNRHQNHLRIWRWQAESDGAQAAFIKTSVAKKVAAEPVTTAWVSPLAKPLYEEHNDCYVEITDDIYCFSDESRWLIASERDGYRHLYLYDFDGKLLRQLTKGNYEVNRLYGVDERHGRVYFSANYSAPYNIEAMWVGLDGRCLRRLAYELQAKG
ncbi:MAG: DPP IV N-terminal domain-containing protein, partial [Bacteroidales bacterium]|nr:DPP IV N-terminal domain-containing protein [Bacteroidales bacterium]